MGTTREATRGNTNRCRPHRPEETIARARELWDAAGLLSEEIARLVDAGGLVDLAQPGGWAGQRDTAPIKAGSMDANLTTVDGHIEARRDRSLTGEFPLRIRARGGRSRRARGHLIGSSNEFWFVTPSGDCHLSNI